MITSITRFELPPGIPTETSKEMVPRRRSQVQASFRAFTEDTDSSHPPLFTLAGQKSTRNNRQYKPAFAPNNFVAQTRRTRTPSQGLFRARILVRQPLESV